MAHHPIPDPDPDPPERPQSIGDRLTEMTPRGADETPPDFEFDFAELSSTFASNEGGALSPELSADLALEVVLNEVVEQACLATGASGAAIILERDGEWVCRASSGRNAPELGDRLRGESSLTGECIRTGQVQNCGDATTDSRVDIEACRSLGIRSVIALPLVQQGTLVGVFTVFSPHPLAFREHEQRTLEALSRSVISNLVRASTASLPFPEAAAPQPQPQPQPESSLEEIPIHQSASGVLAVNNVAQPEIGVNLVSGASDAVADVSDPVADVSDVHTSSIEQPESPTKNVPAGSKALNIAKWGLTAAVLVFAVLLTVLTARRLLATKEPSHKRSPHSVSAAESGPARVGEKPETSTSEPASTSASSRSASNESPNSDDRTLNYRDSTASVKAQSNAAHVSSLGAEPSTRDGGLTVYENGKPIFRMPPQSGVQSTSPAANSSAEAIASTTDSTSQPYNLSPVAAQARLIHRVEPEYPQQAREQRIQGPVVLDVLAGSDGSIANVKLVSGDPLLAGAAIEAVKQWQFKPRFVQGKPVEMQTQITLNFRLPAEAAVH
jgi:TonB family protein